MLYEVTYQKYFPDEALLLDARVHQIPANSELDACAYLCQIFNRENYELRILEVRKVRS